MIGRSYVRIRVRLRTESGRETQRVFWAFVVRPGRAYRIVDNEGQEKSWVQNGVIHEQEQYLLVDPRDVVWERPAYLSRKYGWLVEGQDPGVSG